MAKNKTVETDYSVEDYLDAIIDPARRADCIRVAEIMRLISGYDPKMWGKSIVGFGSCHYKYESGREGDAPFVAFSSRKNALVLYLSVTFDEKENLLTMLGKYKNGKGCIYIKKLTDINEEVLENMIRNSIEFTKQKYPKGY